MEHIPTSSSIIQNPPPLSITQTANVLSSDPPGVISITPNTVRNASEHQIAPHCATSAPTNDAPTVIATQIRAPPPILIQKSVPPSYSTGFQSAVPIKVPTSTDHRYTTPSVVQEAAPNQSTAGNSEVFCFPISAAAMPSAEDTAHHIVLNHSSINQDQQEGSSAGTRRNNGAEGGSKKSKKRKASEQNTADEGTTSREPRSRASSKALRPRGRAPSVPSFDLDVDSGEDIDPTAMTMAALCVDTGQGRVSSKAAEIMNNHAAWKLSNREKRANMKAVMEAKKYGRLEEHGEEQGESSQPPLPAATPATAAANTGNGFDYTEDLSTSRYNVQVRIGPNGETIIDENSLVVDRTENNGTENFTHITESDHTKFVNSATHGKRFRGSRWSAEETDLFYNVANFTPIVISSV